MRKPKQPTFVPPEDQPIVELPPQSYQPSKAELEADARINGFTFEEAIRALVRPVRIRRAKKI